MAFDVEKRFAQHEEMLTELRATLKDQPHPDRELIAKRKQLIAEMVDTVWNEVETATRLVPLNERAEFSRVLMCKALNQLPPETRKHLLDLKLLEELHEILPKKPGQTFHGFDNTIGRTRVLKNTLLSYPDQIAQWGPEAEKLFAEFSREKASAISPSAVRDSQSKGGIALGGK